MEGRFFSGGSLEQALIAAARHYQVEPERIAYQDRSRRQGLLRGGRRVVIEVDPARPTLEEGARQVAAPPSPVPSSPAAASPIPASAVPTASAAAVPVAPVAAAMAPVSAASAPPRPPREARRPEGGAAAVQGTPDEIEALDKAVDAVVDFLDVDIEWEIRRGEDQVPVVELRGEDADLLVARNGELLDAMDHLLPRLVWGWLGRSLPCRVDCNGFQAGHEEKLRRLALEAADRVRASGQGETLAPLAPGDRRVIHVALAEDPDVTTESVGNGFRKRLRIFPRAAAP